MSSFHGIKGVAGPAVHERLSDEYKQEGKRIRTQANGIGQGHYQPASGRPETSKRKISGQEYGAARIGAGDSARQDRSPPRQTYGRGYGMDGSPQDSDLNGYSQAPSSNTFQFRFEPPSQHPKPQAEQPRQQQRIFSQGTKGLEGRTRPNGEGKLDIRDWQGHRAQDRLSPAERPITNGFRDYPTQQGQRAESAFSTGWPTSRGSVEQDEEKPMVNSNGEPVTLRDLINNPELRVEAFRRSLSSQKSDQQQNNSLNMEPQEQGRAPSSTTYYSSNRLIQTRERPMPNGIPRGTRVSSTATTHAPDRRPLHKNNTTTDMDIDGQPSGSQRTNVPTLPSFSFQPSTRGGVNHTNIKGKQSDYRTMMPTERQRTDLYHSSYSPSEFSRDDDEEEEDDQDEGEHDQDTVELTKPIGSSGKATAQNGVQPSTHLQEKGTGGAQVQTQPRPQSKLQPQPQPQSHLQPRPHPHSDNPGDSRDESFEARVAECRARRKGEALGEMQTTVYIAGSSVVPEVVLPRNPSPRPTAPVNRLDRGTSLAVEDLASPTHFNFGTQQPRHHQEQRLTQQPQGSRQPDSSPPHAQQLTADFPTLSTADLPVQQNNLTEHEKLFIELSEGLGEGQTVKLVFGTHKAMIRQLKRENRKLAKKCQQLEKKHEKQRKQLEKTKKANERPTLLKDVPTQRDADNVPSSSQQAAETRAEQEQASHRIAMQQRELDEINRQRNVWKRLIAEAKKQAEESDPLHMLDSDSDDDEDEVDEDTDSESESDEGDQGSIAEDSEGRNHQPSPAKRDSTVKQSSSSKLILGTSSKARQKSKATEDRAQYSHSPSRGRSKSSRETITHTKTISPDVHRIVEKLGEIHIHNHHHHYGSDIKSSTPSPASLSRLAFEDPRMLNRDDAPLEISSDMQRLSIGSGLRPTQRGPVDQDLLTVPASSSRGAFNRSPPSMGSLSADRHMGSPLTEPQDHHTTSQSHTQSTEHPPRNTNGTEAEQNQDSQDYQPFRIRVSGPSSGRSRGHVKFESNPVQDSTASTANPSLRHRKFSIDLHRIKAMCKNHDPRRCVVCRSGRDNVEKHRPPQSLEGHSPRSITITNDRLSTTRFKLSEVAEPESPAIRTPREAKLPVVTSADTGEAGSARSSVRGHDVEPSERHHVDRRGSNSLSNKRSPDLLSSGRKKARRLEEDNHDLTPEQQLHRVIVELTQDIQKVRRSYNELSRDQEALVAEMDGGVGGSVGGGSNNSRKGKGKKVEDDHGASTDKKEGMPESLASQRRQLQASADSLAEKMKNAIRLREHYLQERQRQDQGTGIIRKGSSSASRTGLGPKEPRLEERNVEAVRDTKHGSFSDSDGNRIGKSVEGDNEIKDTQRKRGMSTSKRTDDQNQNTRDGQDTTPRAARPTDRSTDRRKDQRSSPRVEAGIGREESNNDRNEDVHEEEEQDAEGDRESHTKRLKGAPVIRSRLKEPEGYRHRLTSGIRVPKLHNNPHP
ncbi:MAG: hypothetical protein J3Q66DRAFT_343533 [Benniella sp.]|nr:MAG: hypothetical protein J3Q66DRAFT_343533 [Benniella sp.]